MKEGSWARTVLLCLGGCAALAMALFVMSPDLRPRLALFSGPSVPLSPGPAARGGGPAPPAPAITTTAPPPAVANGAVPTGTMTTGAITTGGPAAAPSTATSPPPPPATPPRPAPPEPPRFDVVRVGARGTAVVAGRATPGAEVLLFLDGDREIGRARADSRGEWVILPADPLPAGARELSLRTRLAGEETAGADTVVVLVPAPAPPQVLAAASPPPVPPAGLADAPAVAPALPAPPATGTPPGTPPPATPLAVLLPPPTASGAVPRLLQAPDAPPSPVPAGAAAGAPPPPPSPPARIEGPPRAAAPRLGLDAVDYDEAGGIRFAGTAPPGAAVRVYVDQTHAGDTVADAEGRWVLVPRVPPSFGRHTLRLDQLAAAGAVAARIELPFLRDRLPDAAFAEGRVVVQPGHNLWRIARQAYGRGVRYTVIYQANRDQIRDPDLIYPGQIFALPASAGSAVAPPDQPAPAASNRSR